MASTYSALKIELIGTGEQSGQWGDTTNVNLGLGGAGLEQAIVGMATLVTGDFTANAYTLPYTDTNTVQDFRALVLNITATLSGAGEVIVPAIQKPYIILNNSVGGYAVTVKVTGQTGVSVPNGKSMLVYNNGTDVIGVANYVATLSAGTLTLTTPLAVTSGGTGAATLTANNVLLGNGTSAVQFVAPGTNGNILQSNGTTWTSASVAIGDVVGPASSTDDAFARFNSTTGKLIQNSTATLSDNGSPTFFGPITSRNSSGAGASSLRIYTWNDNTNAEYSDIIRDSEIGSNTTHYVLPAGGGTFEFLIGTTTTQTIQNKTINGGALQVQTTQIASGTTVIDFDSIPSWVKRVTVMFDQLSTSGTSLPRIQIGTGGTPATVGYIGSTWYHSTSGISASAQTAGFVPRNAWAAAQILSGFVTISNMGGNIWVANGYTAGTGGLGGGCGGSIDLGGALDIVRITTANGTDVFDAGSVNVSWE